MKTTLKILAASAIIAATACNSKKTEDANADSDSMAMMSSSDMDNTATYTVTPGNYTDLTTGKTVYVIADPETGYAIDSISKAPIEFYIDTKGDTISKTGMVVSNAMVNTNGVWSVDETKVKVQDDGDIKIKGPDGKLKLKDDKSKLKDEDGKVKITDDTVKIKN